MDHSNIPENPTVTPPSQKTAKTEAVDEQRALKPRHPKVLLVEAGKLTLLDIEQRSYTLLLDVSARTPRWWRKVEELLRFDIALALQARFAEDQCDIVWAGSEKVGIPLSFVYLRKPLVVVAHHMSSPLKAKFARVMGVVNRWAGIGFISDESREFFINYFGVPPERLFQYESSKYLGKAAALKMSYDGPIISAGVAKRDYPTLISALADLPGYEAELFTSSKFGDKLKKKTTTFLPPWVKLMGWVSDEELVRRYQHTRFVVVPLQDTTHSGAGINAVLEAGAFGKAVIATKTGGMATFVKDGETGILVPPYDIEAWKSALQKLGTQPELAYQMGQANRRYIESRFNPKEVELKILRFLDNLVVGKSR